LRALERRLRAQAINETLTASVKAAVTTTL